LKKVLNLDTKYSKKRMKNQKNQLRPKNRPFVKLFTLIPGGPLKDTSDRNIQFIASTYGWINSHGGFWLKSTHPHLGPHVGTEYFAGQSAGIDMKGCTVGQRLREINPELILSNYRNGAYTQQYALDEAMEAESKFPLAIAVFNTDTTLVKALSTTDTTVLLNPPPEKPNGFQEIYPFKASTANGEHTKNKKHYVAWLRLEDEILRINNAEITDNDLIKLTVVRGIWNTEVSPHGEDVVVLAPIYCGNIWKNGMEYYLSGLPDGNSQQPAIRYIYMQQKLEFWKFLSDKVAEMFEEGYNGPWFDCTVSSWINHSNAYGVRVPGPYDVDLGRLLDRETYREYHQHKLDYLFKRFPKGEFYVNWFFPEFYFENGHEKLMFSGENGHHPISGGAIELYASSRMDWYLLTKMQIDAVKNGYIFCCWVKCSLEERRRSVDMPKDGSMEDIGMPLDYLMFAYGTFLLVYEPDAPQVWGGAWGRPGEQSSFVPPTFVYWDLGEPKEHFDDIAQAELDNASGVYCRHFKGGMVLVNPSKEESRLISLNAKYYEPERGEWVSSVTLRSRTAVLLLRANLANEQEHSEAS